MSYVVFSPKKTMNKTKYRRLCQEDRGVIYRMNKAGKGQQEIADAIGFTQSAVSRELNRNKGKRGYRNKQAQTMATLRQKMKRTRSRVISGDLKELVDSKLEQKHSPEQISGRLQTEGYAVSHESIYQYIAEDKASGGDLYRHLRINSKRRYRRRSKAQRVGKILERIDIEERGEVVENRERYGDWEVDLVEGSKGSGFILSLYERKSQFAKIGLLTSKSAAETSEGIVKLLKNYRVETLTYDNGLEFAGHLEVNAKLKCESYFCKPYHSWEKGGVENYNGLLRQYFPKGSDFRKICSSMLRSVEDQINRRPRKGLDYLSPSELEHKLTKAA